MTTSEATYHEAISEFHRAGGSGLFRRIVQVAYLRAREEGLPAWTWLEDTISRFKNGIETTYSSYAATSSYARAVAHYGMVDDRPLRATLDELDPNRADYAEAVIAEVAKVNRDKASRTRRASGIRADGTRWGDTYPVFRSVETLIQLATNGDVKAKDELGMIREALRLS